MDGSVSWWHQGDQAAEVILKFWHQDADRGDGKQAISQEDQKCIGDVLGAGVNQQEEGWKIVGDQWGR